MRGVALRCSTRNNFNTNSINHQNVSNSVRSGGKKGASTSHGMRTKSTYRNSKDANSFMAIGVVANGDSLVNKTMVE